MAALSRFYKSDSLDFSLAFHCAPVLCGLKPANLIALSRRKREHWREELVRCEESWHPQGLYVLPLAQCPRRTLLLVYRGELLRQCLNRPENRSFLRRQGYRVDECGVEGLLQRLRERMNGGQGEYPHEIGIFLGYPVSDVAGFIHHKGEGCKLSGYWKVYGDPGRAKKQFDAYDAARQLYCGRVLRGETIHTIQTGGCSS